MVPTKPLRHISGVGDHHSSGHGNFRNKLHTFGLAERSRRCGEMKKVEHVLFLSQHFKAERKGQLRKLKALEVLANLRDIFGFQMA